MKTVAMLFTCLCSMFYCDVCTGQVTQRDLRGFAKSAVDGNYFFMCPPKFDWDGEYLQYDLGGVWDPLVKLPSEGIEIPLYVQCHVVLIQKTRIAPNQRRFWTPILQRIERKVAKMLRLINEGNLDKEQLSTALLQIKNEIFEIYDTELNALAKRKGKKGAIEGSVAGMEMFNVKFITRPGNGKIKIIPLGHLMLREFLQAKGVQTNRDLDWTTVNDNLDLCIGKYRVHCDWPRGKVCDDNIRVSKSGQKITVYPDN